MNRFARYSLAVLVAAAVPLLAEEKVSQLESLGFSIQGIKAYQQATHALVDEGRLAGVVTLVARHGKLASFDAYGYRDLDAKAKVAKDTIFRLASMTKPIVGVAMMILWEEGKWALDDPVAKFVPEFKDLKVATASGEVPQVHPMTMRELMSHTAGFDVSRGYEKVNLTDRERPLQAMIDKLAKLPLAAQPGTDWRYGPSVDIQGYIVEKLSGKGLDEFLSQCIFEPLKMRDTGFFVEQSNLARLTRVHAYDAEQHLAAIPQRTDPSKKPVFLSGSGGLFSTASDYWRFSQMLLNGGVLDGARILKPASVEKMRQNVLAEGVKVDTYGSPLEGLGFGLDFALLLDPVAAGSPAAARNSYFWGGAYGTWFWIDPTNDLIAVGMIQNVNGSLPDGGTPPMRTLSRKLVYEALTDPKL